MEPVVCPIWNSKAYPLAGYGNRDGNGYDSPRAGGRYFISRSAEICLQNISQQQKVALTHEICDHNALGSVIEILTTTLDNLPSRPDFPPVERADRLLQYLIKITPHLGAELIFPVDLDFGAFAAALPVKDSSSTDPLFAWSDSTERDEIRFLLAMLAEERAIRLPESSGFDGIVVLPNGYTRAKGASLDHKTSQAFIAMWFDQSMIEPYESGIENAVRKSGFRPLRIDRKEHINKIDDEIVAEIKRSRFLVADFTSAPEQPRGGVYFEAGYALALGLPVIWTCRSDMIDKVHFDTRQFNHIVWNSSQDLGQQLEKRILAVIGQGPVSMV